MDPKYARKLCEAVTAHQAGNVDTAGRLYAEILQNRPDEFDALNNLGVLECQLGNLPKALGLFAAALRSNGNSADAWSNLGFVLQAQGEEAKALTSYDRALELEPGHANAMNSRKKTLDKLRCHDSARCTEEAAEMKLKAVSRAPMSCKICGASAPLYGVVDFQRSCEIPGGTRLPLSGIPVYYRRCETCGFLFTDAFDPWSEAEFKAHIYNADYLAIDPEYDQTRPRNSAAVVERLFGAHKADVRVLDYGGGNDLLSSTLRGAGFPTAVTYDPFVPDYALRPEGTFDLVTCFQTLEHMPDPMAGIAAMLATLAEPGIVLFSTLLQPQDFDRLGLNWWYVGPRNGHVSIFSRHALVLAWQHFGYQTASFTNNLHIAFRTLPIFAKHLLEAGS